jgi:putative ABC transport system permease protein
LIGTSLLWTSYRRYLARNLWLLLLSVCAVATGVAVILAIDIASISAKKSFTLSLQALTGRSNYVVVGAGQRVDEAFYKTLRVDWGIRDSAPVVEGYLSFPDKLFPKDPGKAIPLTLLGVDPLADASIRAWTGGLIETPTENGQGDLSDLIGSTEKVIATRETAQKLDWRLGSSREVWVGSEQKTLTLAGVFVPADNRSSAALDNVLLTDISVAQSVFERFGLLDRIDLVLAEEDVEGLESRLPPGMVLQKSGQSHRTANELSAAFHVNLGALSYLCLLVGTFLIFNVVSFTVSHRRESLGRLRVIGVTGKELAFLLMGEALWLGVIGGILGTVAGLTLGRFLVPLVTRTLNDLYYVHAITRFSVDPWLLIKAFGSGLLATLLAAAVPALMVARAEPLELLKRVEGKESTAGGASVALGCGLALLALAALILLHPSLTAGLLSLLLVVLGYALTVPAWLHLFCSLTGSWPKQVATRMAIRGISAFLGRTSLAAVALTIAVAAAISISMMVSSFRGTLTAWLETTLTADIYLTLKDRAGLNSGGYMDSAKVDEAIRMAGVTGWVGQRAKRVPSSTGETFLVGVKAGGEYRSSLIFLESVPNAWEALERGEGIFVTEPYSRRADLGLGSELQISTPTGEQRMPVLGVYYSYAPDRNLAVMASSRFQEMFGDEKWSAIGLYLAEGPESAEVKTELRRLFGEDIEIQATGDLKQLALIIFDRTFTVTEVLRFLALGVAFIGVYLSLLALCFERTGEIRVLRALGLSTRELFRLSLSQSLILGAISGLLAFPLGLLLSYQMITIINRRAFGWTITFQPDWTGAWVSLGLAMLAALIAGLYPAWRWSRQSEEEALRERE